MSDEPTTESTETTGHPHEAKQVNPTVVLVAFAFAAILSFALLVWAQGIRLAAAQRAAFARGVDGLSAALAQPVIELGSLRFENRADRLQKIIESVQRAGDYQSIVVTDPKGTVLATTDTSLKGQSVKEMADPPSPTKIKEVDGTIEANTAILSDGSNKIGSLRIRVRL